MDTSHSPLEKALKQPQWLTSAALLLVILCSWGYLYNGAGTGMSARAMSDWHFPPAQLRSSGSSLWSPGYCLLMFLMWWIMMIAMMLPSAAPMILLHGRLTRHYATVPHPALASALFTTGYCMAWAGFSLLAVCIHALLEYGGMVHAMMMWITVPELSAALLIGAGLYQLSPWKQACLKHCQSPAAFISNHWQSGYLGSFQMGTLHGLFCLGCCWMLMLLLFVGGAMNLYWIIGLALWVLFEKLLPANRILLPISALLLFISAIALLK